MSINSLWVEDLLWVLPILCSSMMNNNMSCGNLSTTHIWFWRLIYFYGDWCMVKFSPRTILWNRGSNLGIFVFSIRKTRSQLIIFSFTIFLSKIWWRICSFSKPTRLWIMVYNNFILIEKGTSLIQI